MKARTNSLIGAGSAVAPVHHGGRAVQPDVLKGLERGASGEVQGQHRKAFEADLAALSGRNQEIGRGFIGPKCASAGSRLLLWSKSA